MACLDKRLQLTGLSYQMLKVCEWPCQCLWYVIVGYSFSAVSSISIFTIELTIRGGHCSPYTYPKAISMIEKKQLPLEVCYKLKLCVNDYYIPCSPLQDIITHRLPLKDVEKGLKLVNSSKESIKVVLLPSQDVES